MGLGTALGTYRYNQYGSASGGTSSSITSSGVSYTLLTFTTDGTLTVSKDGLFDVLLVGGGGNGGNTITNERAGGGGGGGGSGGNGGAGGSGIVYVRFKI